MYCGQNPTALTSQRQIADALIRLMQIHPYGEITVSALCREAEISRQTFYSLFQSMDNVVRFALQTDCCDLPTAPAQLSLTELCQSYSLYMCRNRDVLKLLVEHQMDSLLYGSVYDSFSRCDCFLGRLPEAERAYTAHFLAGGLTGVTREYCLTEPPMDARSLGRILERLLSGAGLSLQSDC